jgi:hypothetical protein
VTGPALLGPWPLRARDARPLMPHSFKRRNDRQNGYNARAHSSKHVPSIPTGLEAVLGALLCRLIDRAGVESPKLTVQGMLDGARATQLSSAWARACSRAFGRRAQSIKSFITGLQPSTPVGRRRPSSLARRPAGASASLRPSRKPNATVIAPSGRSRPPRGPGPRDGESRGSPRGPPRKGPLRPPASRQ